VTEYVSRFPGKRVGVLVMTHYHWDHSGGLREYVAENVPVVTLEANAAFVRQVAAARRTVRPDLQARRRRNPTVRTFADSTVIGSGGRSWSRWRAREVSRRSGTPGATAR
jgi:glyoxylase-like metal-dependent hydrolase (beta-lactamase superfamily II)